MNMFDSIKFVYNIDDEMKNIISSIDLKLSKIKITINKENVVWGLVVCKLQLDDVKKFDEKLEIEETDFLEAIDEYEKIIDIKIIN